ncbi:hypothetical protein TNCV_2248691 [Trichonephila clavipes]|nr:hypothetical protein TNCV_2248691 [Trichonephila clavipes]
MAKQTPNSARRNAIADALKTKTILFLGNLQRPQPEIFSKCLQKPLTLVKPPNSSKSSNSYSSGTLQRPGNDGTNLLQGQAGKLHPLKTRTAQNAQLSFRYLLARGLGEVASG